MRKLRLTVLVFFVLIITAIALFTSITVIRAEDSNADIRAAVVVGQKAPPFHLKPINGKLVNFPDDYKGKIVLLDFWATWCGPCCEELPNVVAAYQKYHDKGFDIVSVSLDDAGQGPQLLQFMKDHDMTWPQNLRRRLLESGRGNGIRGPRHPLPCGCRWRHWKNFGRRRRGGWPSPSSLIGNRACRQERKINLRDIL